MTTLLSRHTPAATDADLAEAERLAAELDALAKDNFFDPSWRVPQFDTLVATIMLGWQHENLVSLLAEVEQADEDERIVIEDARGLDVYWVSQGGQIDQTRITSRRWELQRHFAGWHISENEDKIRLNFSKYQRIIRQAATVQVDAAVNSRLLRTYQAAIPDVSSPYFITGAGFTLSQLDTAISECVDEGSETGDETVTVVGRAPMIDQIYNQLVGNNNFAPNTQEEIIRTGKIGVYHGCTIVRLKNFRDRARRPYFPGNELFVVNNSAAKVGFWQPIKSKEWIEEGGEYWHAWSKRPAGFAVWRPERVRRFVDTSLPA